MTVHTSTQTDLYEDLFIWNSISSSGFSRLQHWHDNSFNQSDFFFDYFFFFFDHYISRPPFDLKFVCDWQPRPITRHTHRKRMLGCFFIFPIYFILFFFCFLSYSFYPSDLPTNTLFYQPAILMGCVRLEFSSKCICMLDVYVAYIYSRYISLFSAITPSFSGNIQLSHLTFLMYLFIYLFIYFETWFLVLLLVGFLKPIQKYPSWNRSDCRHVSLSARGRAYEDCASNLRVLWRNDTLSTSWTINLILVGFQGFFFFRSFFLSFLSSFICVIFSHVVWNYFNFSLKKKVGKLKRAWWRISFPCVYSSKRQITLRLEERKKRDEKKNVQLILEKTNGRLFSPIQKVYGVSVSIHLRSGRIVI